MIPGLKRYLFLICCVFAIMPASAQVEEDLSQALNTPPNPFVRFDSKNSFISTYDVRIWGLNLGMNHNDVFKYGIGFYSLQSAIYQNFLYTDYQGAEHKVESRLHYDYFGVFGEYVFYSTKHWEASLPLQVGLGNTRFSGTLADSSLQFSKQFIMQYEAALTGHYRFLRYFALGGGIGYRIMIIPNSDMDLQLTSPIYIMKLKFFLGDVYRDTRDWICK